MEELVQVNAKIPRKLKQRAFAVLALHDERFNRWLKMQLEHLVGEGEHHERERGDERVARSQTRG